jgi:hypothetical protein
MSYPRLGKEEGEMENLALPVSQLSLSLCVDYRHNAPRQTHSHGAGSKMHLANLVVAKLSCGIEWLYLL